MIEQNKYLVCVRCYTFNQANYIVDALNGFTMQKTSFPFICTILDDASTDGEQEVLSKYLDDNFSLDDTSTYRREETNDYIMVFAQHKNNHNCFFAVYYLKYNHYRIKKSKLDYIAEWSDAKYIATCEGDDYWFDRSKLQDQVDFMEQHPEHSLCFCSHRNKYSNGNVNEVIRYPNDVECCPMKDAIHCGGAYMATASMLYRTDMAENRPQWSLGLPIGDLPLMLVLMGRGKCGYINRVMVCYRVSSDGSWTNLMKKDKKRRLYLFSSVKRMYKEFDKWTKREYHSSIVKRCWEVNMYIIRLKLGLLK